MSRLHQPDQELQAAADAPDQFFRELEIQFLIHELKDPIAIIETGLRTLLEKREKFGPLSPKHENTLKRTRPHKPQLICKYTLTTIANSRRPTTPPRTCNNIRKTDLC